MVLIPTGVTWLDGSFTLNPGIWAHVDAYFIDVTEVTVGAYRRCVEDDGEPCSPPSAGDEGDGCLYRSDDNVDAFPMNCISRKEALDYCAWLNLGARLPSKDEWIRAARGDDDRSYPWGEDSPTCLHTISACDPVEELLAPVRTKPLGASVFEVHDMIGNVAEWIWDSDTYDNAGDVDVSIMGAGISSIVWGSHVVEATDVNPFIGFRCALPVK